MEHWNTVVHTALLGTDKHLLTKEDLPLPLAAILEYVAQKEPDKETSFLQVASAVQNYTRCGLLPHKAKVDFVKASDEEKPFCNAAAHSAIKAIMNEENEQLLSLWINTCMACGCIVQPEFVSVLFNFAVRHKHLQTNIISVAGKRGEWLMQLNSAWQFELPADPDNTWQTGSTEQRKQILTDTRTRDGASGRELLQQTWAQEAANAKAELLKQLAVNISDDDVPWLEQLLNEKSAKVKDEASKLLKHCAVSSVVQQYWHILKQAVTIRKEKGLLGIGSKTVLHIQLINPVEEHIFKTGIEKISSEKNTADDDHLLYQLIAGVPPHFFETQYTMDMAALLELFSKTKGAKQFIPAFGLAAAKFKNMKWLKAVTALSENNFYPEALQLFSREEKEQYALSFLDRNLFSSDIIQHLHLYHKEQWGKALTLAIFKHTAANHYQYGRAFYGTSILSFANIAASDLKQMAPAMEWESNSWDKTSDYILQLLTLRQQTLQAFKQNQ